MPASRTPKLLARTLSASSSIPNAIASSSKPSSSSPSTNEDKKSTPSASASSSSSSKHPPLDLSRFKAPKSASTKPKPNASSSSTLKQATLPFLSTLPAKAAAPSLPPSDETVAKFERLFPGLDKDLNLPLLELEMSTMGEDWLEALKEDLATPGFLALKAFLDKEWKSAKVFPPKEDIYSFSRLSKLDDIKLVIIGQDPYHQPGQAHGLSFSVRKGVQVPPSLRNIYKEIKIEYPSFEIPKNGDLTSLATQGVLLLNTSLTVRANTAASHSKAGWEPFTRSILRLLGQPSSTAGGKGKVFMCWGKHAEKALEGAGVDEKTNLVLRSVHPSPLSASRGFFETGHFKEADEWLKERWGAEGGVDWTRAGKD